MTISATSKAGNLGQPAAKIRSRQIPAIASQQFFTHGVISLWFWPIFIAILLVTYAVANHFDALNTSHLAGASQALVWFPFSVSIGLMASYFNPYLAAGVTRRVLSQGFAMGVLGISAVQAAVYTGLFYLERTVYTNQGWAHVVRYGKEPDERIVNPATGGLFKVFLGIWLVVAMAMISGHLVSMMFIRFRVLAGIITIPLTVVLPLFLMGHLTMKAGSVGPFGYIELWNSPFDESTSGFILAFALLVVYIFALDRVIRVTALGPGA